MDPYAELLLNRDVVKHRQGRKLANRYIEGKSQKQSGKQVWVFD